MVKTLKRKPGLVGFDGDDDTDGALAGRSTGGGGGISKKTVKDNFVRVGDEYMCKICSRHIKSHLRVHYIEQHVENGVEFACPICASVLKTRDSLRVHFKRKHSLQMTNAQLDPYMRPKESDDTSRKITEAWTTDLPSSL